MAWAVVGGIMQGLSLGAQAKGAQAGGHAERALSAGIKRQWIEDFRTMTKEYQATRGTQLARYGASGVDLVGSVATVTQETRDEYHRAVAAEAFATKQRLKGAQLQGKAVKYAQVGGYFSSIASFAASMTQYQQAKDG